MVIDDLSSQRIKETFEAAYETKQNIDSLKESNKDILKSLAESLKTKAKHVNKAFKLYCNALEGKVEEKEDTDESLILQHAMGDTV